MRTRVGGGLRQTPPRPAPVCPLVQSSRPHPAVGLTHFIDCLCVFWAVICSVPPRSIFTAADGRWIALHVCLEATVRSSLNLSSYLSCPFYPKGWSQVSDFVWHSSNLTSQKLLVDKVTRGKTLCAIKRTMNHTLTLQEWHTIYNMNLWISPWDHCMSIHLSICLYQVCLSVYSSVYSSVYICLSMSIDLSIEVYEMLVGLMYPRLLNPKSLADHGYDSRL